MKSKYEFFPKPICVYVNYYEWVAVTTLLSAYWGSLLQSFDVGSSHI